MKSSRLLLEASMLKKEINDVLKQTLFFVLIILLLPAFLVLTKIYPDPSYLNAFFPVFQFGLFFWAFFMGASLFSVERGQNGMEYLLSLPLSRYKLMGLKVSPRFINILIFYGIYLILYLGTGISCAGLSLICFSFIYFSLYFISISFSASLENFLVHFIATFLFLFFILGLEYSLFWLTIKIKGYIYFTQEITPFITGNLEPFTITYIIITGICLLLPFLAAFTLSIKKFDIKPPRVHNRRFLKFFAPLFILGLLVSFFLAQQIIHIGYSDYYLTQDHILIEYNAYFGFRIYDSEKVHKIKGQYNYFSPFAENDSCVFAKADDSILRIDTSDFKVETLYESLKQRHLFSPQKSGNNIAFLEYSEKDSERSEWQVVFLDISSKKESKFSPDFDSLALKNLWVYNLLGVDTFESKEFWLLYSWSHKKNQVFQLWQDGTLESIKKTQHHPLYISPFLITYTDKDILISKYEEGRFETIQKIPNEKGYQFMGTGYRPWFWSEEKNKMSIKEIYGMIPPSNKESGEHTICARLDLETFELEELYDVNGWPYCFGAGECYFEEKNIQDGTLSIYRLDDSQIKLLRKFNLSFENTFHPYEIFKSGIVIKKGKKVKVYAFPDLKEIKYKKL